MSNTIFAIDPQTCVECGQCRRFCPLKGAITINEDYQHVVNADVCSGCGLCEAFCPVPGTLFSVDLTQSAEYLQTLRRVVWRGLWQYENHPIMGALTAEARDKLATIEQF